MRQAHRAAERAADSRQGAGAAAGKPLYGDGAAGAGAQGEHMRVLDDMRRAGYVRMFIDGEVRTLDEDIRLEKNKKHSLSVVIDRLAVREGIRQRLTDSVETALKLADGFAEVATLGEQRKRNFSASILPAMTAASACRRLNRACFPSTIPSVPARTAPVLACIWSLTRL